ncbi:hypothetical protein [Pseudolysobacter antarcticus]|nr:hypothetical protein [Pseudolysobacter antarcticus]
MPTFNRSLAASLCVFLLSRLIIFGIWSSVACINVVTPSIDEAFADVNIVIDADRVGPELRKIALYNDASWYYGIALNGYEARPFDKGRQANWAFFPAFPLLWRGVMATGMDAAVSGLLISNILFLLGLFLLHRLTLDIGHDLFVADRALMFLAFCPTSYFFSLPWTESLFLVLSVGTFLVMIKKHWELMFVLGACACACRLVGLFLVPSLLLYLWPQRGVISRKAWIAIAAMPLGFVAFTIVLWNDSGNFFAFSDIQQEWGRHLTIPYKSFGVVLIKPWFLASDWNLRPLNFVAFLGGCCACYWLARRPQNWGLALFLGLGLLAPALTGSLTSLARYSFALFPFAIAAGNAFKNPKLELSYIILSVTFLVLLTLAFQKQLAFAGA